MDARDSILSVLCPRPVDHPAVRLYLLHHAGGSHTTFRPWLPLLPPEWEVHLVVAPGRPKAAAHPAVRDLAVVADALADWVTAPDHVPYALFGHSMGALTAFGATLTIEAAGRRAPAWVGVSGHPGPFGSITPYSTPLYQLPPDELRTALTDLDGLPQRVVRDSWLWERVQPIVRADLEAAETFTPLPPPALLTRPLSVYCGDRDPVARPETIRWAGHSTDFLGLRWFPGGHFYFQDDPEPLVAAVVDDLRSVLARPVALTDGTTRRASA